MLSEKEWVVENLSYKSCYWDELLGTGRVQLVGLENGRLKDLFTTFLSIEGDIQKELESLGYQAG